MSERRAAAWQARANQAYGRTTLALDDEIEALLAEDDALPAGFHRLVVTEVDRLCDDAVAVTFDVPEDLRGHYAFRPGQYLTLRKDTADGEERRSYSICAPAGEPPRIGVREVAGGKVSGWLVREVRAAGQEVSVRGARGAARVSSSGSRSARQAEEVHGHGCRVRFRRRSGLPRKRGREPRGSRGRSEGG